MRFTRPGPVKKDLAYVAIAALRAKGPIAALVRAVDNVDAPGAIATIALVVC
jgi:hypothetical protein